jgi:hypothetical protein
MPLLYWLAHRPRLRPVLVSHDCQDPGKIRYSGPVLYFMVKNVLNFPQNGFLSKIRFFPRAAQVCSPTTQAKAAAAAAQLQRRKWNLLRSKFGFEIAHSCPGITTCQQHELMLSVSSLHLLPRSRSRALRHRNPFLKCFPSKRICLPLQAAAASRASSSMPTNRDHEIYNYTSGRWL